MRTHKKWTTILWTIVATNAKWIVGEYLLVRALLNLRALLITTVHYYIFSIVSLCAPPKKLNK